jgi:hypothetical protein
MGHEGTTSSQVAFRVRRLRKHVVFAQARLRAARLLCGARDREGGRHEGDMLPETSSSGRGPANRHASAEVARAEPPGFVSRRQRLSRRSGAFRGPRTRRRRGSQRGALAVSQSRLAVELTPPGLQGAAARNGSSFRARFIRSDIASLRNPLARTGGAMLEPPRSMRCGFMLADHRGTPSRPGGVSSTASQG